jgi:ABC-type multidrug transport system fused ATPase/permease subunit
MNADPLSSVGAGPDDHALRETLARAVGRDAPILIPDEPTSAVDRQTEAAIVGSTERLMRGRTAFAISHRDSTLATCTTRLMIEAGELAVGSHRPVPATGGAAT